MNEISDGIYFRLLQRSNFILYFCKVVRSTIDSGITFHREFVYMNGLLHICCWHASIILDNNRFSHADSDYSYFCFCWGGILKWLRERFVMESHSRFNNDQHCCKVIQTKMSGINCGVVGWGTMLHTGTSRVWFRMRSLEFSVNLILPAALWPWGRLSL
jgi:hypothetical protein